MGATLLFVHGTGLRASGYAATLERITERAAHHCAGLEVRGCFWGEAEGARLLSGGKSIPGYETSGGRPPTEADRTLAVWSMLYTDPWYELRLLRHMPAGGPIGFGQVPPSVKLRRDVEEFTPSAELGSELEAASLAVRFNSALAALRSAPEFDQAAATAPPDSLEHRRAIGRALIAHALLAAEDDGEPPIDGGTRDALVERITDELHGYGLGVGDFLLRPFKGIAARTATRKLTGDRGALSDAAAPMAGDILRFLAHGDGVRAFIREAIADHAPGPVYVLGHSLGGIMSVDLLVRQPVPEVAGLVTVGSQAPFLYEIGALPGLSHPNPLPGFFPPWLNVYDRRDILSYVGAGVLGGGVRDVSVDNGQPFPQSHSAYWTNPALWDAVAEAVA